MRYRNASRSDRFSNYRPLVSRFDSAGSCGHEIKAGDLIGYHGGLKKTQCAACWQRWCAENAEADAYERSLPEGF